MKECVHTNALLWTCLVLFAVVVCVIEIVAVSRNAFIVLIIFIVKVVISILLSERIFNVSGAHRDGLARSFTSDDHRTIQVLSNQHRGIQRDILILGLHRNGCGLARKKNAILFIVGNDGSQREMVMDVFYIQNDFLDLILGFLLTWFLSKNRFAI